MIKDQFIQALSSNINQYQFEIPHKQIPHQAKGIKISFHNLVYEVPIKQPDNQMKLIQKQLLKGISGQVLSGQTLYIMGPSGSGKTSLLNCLSERVAQKGGVSIRGKVLVNDIYRLNNDLFGKIGAYVMQDDSLYSYFTPKQAIKFAANLKLNLPKKEINKRVSKLIYEFKLSECQNTIIGNINRKTISGGERKRTAIAVGLVTDPLLLFLDEPTSGLDSINAFQVVKILQKLADKGKTIVSTIHSPNSDSFKRFDQLMLMVEGQIIYQGNAKDSVNYFNQIGFLCPKYSNPADYYLKMMAISYPISEYDEKKIKFLVSNYENYRLPEKQCIQNSYLSEIEIMEFGKQHRPSLKTQFKQLIKRDAVGLFQNPHQMRALIFRQIVVGLLVLAIFFKLDGDSKQDMFGLAGCLFYISLNQFMMNMTSNIMIYQMERPLFLREYAEKMYDFIPYYIAKTILEIPIILITQLIFTFIVFFGVGLVISFSSFMKFYLTLILINFAAFGTGTLFSIAFNSPETAEEMAPVILIPLGVLSGFVVNINNVPNWIVWLQYVSPIRYGLEALIQNEFTRRELPEGTLDPIDFLNFNFGYAGALSLLLTVGLIVRLLPIIALYFRVSKTFLI